MNKYADLDDILTECYNISKDNTENITETIVMSIKKEDNGDPLLFAEAVNSYIQKNESNWFLENRVPYIGEGRDKIILFRRYSQSDKGIVVSSGWPDGCILMDFPSDAWLSILFYLK